MAKRREAAKPPGEIGKRVAFDRATWMALDLYARDSMKTLQEIADEAFADFLKKHGRPVDLKDALKRSARAIGANDNPNRRGAPALAANPCLSFAPTNRGPAMTRILVIAGILAAATLLGG